MAVTDSPSCIAACLRRSQDLSHSDSARLDTELLLLHVLKRERAYLYTWPENQLTEEQLFEFDALFERRKQGEPIAHLIGSREFWTLELKTNNSTLIPRPDTELLVEAALEKCFEGAHVLDLGTGTGAIALALASEFPSIKVDAVDVSEHAVALAEINRKMHSLSNVTIMQGAWFENVSGCYDLIVSNPPYIEECDPHLTQGDVRFEPLSALTSGPDGLDDIRHIAKQSSAYLHDQAWLMLEHGWNQGEAVCLLLIAEGFVDVETIKDLSGNDRVTMGRYLER